MATMTTECRKDLPEQTPVEVLADELPAASTATPTATSTIPTAIRTPRAVDPVDKVLAQLKRNKFVSRP